MPQTHLFWNLKSVIEFAKKKKIIEITYLMTKTGLKEQYASQEIQSKCLDPSK